MTVELTIEAAVAATAGTLEQGGAAAFSGLSIDSRSVEPGQAFVAVAGERFDGHAFCEDAVARGAVLLVVERPVAGGVPSEVAVLRVSRTREALGQLARAWRRLVAPEVVAITGSVGKTTTKELTCGLVARLGTTHVSPGNFNNEIGLPLTLLAMPRDTRYLVAELGMNAPGEIAYLTGLAAPTVGVITCVAPVHLEGLGTLEAVAEAKGELLRGLPEGAWAVVPGQEPLLARSLERVPAHRRVRFGSGDSDEVRIVEVESQGVRGSRVRLALRGEQVGFDLPLVGRHNVANAAAAAGAAMVLGLSAAEIGAALSEARPALVHRSRVVQLGAWHLFDDCYNANPVATMAALDTTVQLAGAGGALAVLGVMLELGAQSERYHLEVGHHAARVGLKALITVGEEAAAIARGAREAGMPAEAVVEAEEVDQAVEAAATRAAPGSWILVKGSRGARLERVVEGLERRAARGTQS